MSDGEERLIFISIDYRSSVLTPVFYLNMNNVHEKGCM